MVSTSFNIQRRHVYGGVEIAQIRVGVPLDVPASALGANLFGANLTRADLSGADLSFANLSDVVGWSTVTLEGVRGCDTATEPRPLLPGC